ncbi:site-specific DNA-methyltransferase [Thalassospira sp. MIT1370]|uniref:site-specific DNA-methyltransferase n=1 Tax=Thalassospira sp. MIT1370 TaxID=3093720 RepID=UPI00399A5D01
MEKLKMHSPDLSQENIAKMRQLFPGCVTEATDENGKVRLAVDFVQLRQELSDNIIEGPQERYRLDWPGKREAMINANAPIAKTLRPVTTESADFERTKNLFLEGDNLEALKLIQQIYLGSIRTIYIDPPYNTGNDFVYRDKFAQGSEEYLQASNQKDEEGNRLLANVSTYGRFHSDWLSMIYPRIKLARNCLRDDGALWISIDDREVANLISVLREVFGNDHYVSTFVWQKRKTRENRKVVSTSHDFIVCVAKDKSIFEQVRNLLPLTEEARGRYNNPDNDPRGDWQSVAITAQAGHGTKAQFYTITTPSGRLVELPSGSCWRFTKVKLQELIEDNRIWFGADGSNVPRQKVFLSEQNAGLTPHTIWTADEVGTTDSAKRALNEMFDGVSVFETPKPVQLLQRIIQISTNPTDDIVMDFFAGSAPAAQATMAQNAADGGRRRFIMVQIPEPCEPGSEPAKAGYATIAEIAKERIRRAGKKILEGERHPDWNSDVGFRVLKIDTSNMEDVYYRPDELDQKGLLDTVDNIKKDRTPEDLLFQVLVDWGVDLTLPIRRETVQDKTVFFVDENALVACFETGVTEELVKELAKAEPLRVVFRDNGFVSDAVKINVEQIFRQLSPTTDVKSI